MSAPRERDDRAPTPAWPQGVLVVRPGRGANCSSVGSVVDMLFVAGAAGGALLVALQALAGDDPPRATQTGAPAGDAGQGDADEGPDRPAGVSHGNTSTPGGDR